MNATSTPRSRTFLLVLVAITFASFSPVLRNDFVAWDDPQTIIEHPGVNPATFSAVIQYWQEPLSGLYVPLTYTVWSAIGSVARDAAGTLHAWPFHLASVIVHCVSAGLVFSILRQLLHEDWPAFVGAMSFALHPLQVESIAWASGLKDVLAGCFALAALVMHLRSRTVVSTILFTLAMYSKPSGASALPIAILIDVLVRRRSIRPTAKSVVPWLIVMLPLLGVARMVQTTELVEPVSLLNRPIVAIDAIAFYLKQLLVPLNLAIHYGRTPARVINASHTLSLVLFITVALALAASRSRVLVGAALIMIAGLVWNLGLVPFQFQLHSTVADHYMYLAMLGPALAVACAATRYNVIRPIALTVCALFAILSFRQTLIWQDSVTLFTHAVAVNPQSAVSHNNLGRVLGERGDLDGAATHFRAALAIQSGTALAHRNLALVEYRRGNFDSAIDELSQSIVLMEQNHEYVAADRSELVRWLANRNRWPEVVVQLERAQAADPTNPDIARVLDEARQHATATTVPSTQ